MLLCKGQCGALGRCRITPPRFLAECHKRQLNQGSFVSAVCLVVYSLICIVFICAFLWFLFSFLLLIVCLSVTVKWLAVKSVPEMTYNVSGGALKSTQSNLCWMAFKSGHSPASNTVHSDPIQSAFIAPRRQWWHLLTSDQRLRYTGLHKEFCHCLSQFQSLLQASDASAAVKCLFS